jgi:hypothetical protein
MALVPFHLGPGLCLPACPIAESLQLGNMPLWLALESNLLPITQHYLVYGSRPGEPYESLAVDMAPPRKCHLNPRARRALELLASNALGLTEPFMFAHGFTRSMVAALVRTGFITTRHEVTGVRGKMIKITRIEITAAGRWALEADRREPRSWQALENFPQL